MARKLPPNVIKLQAKRDLKRPGSAEFGQFRPISGRLPRPKAKVIQLRSRKR